MSKNMLITTKSLSLLGLPAAERASCHASNIACADKIFQQGANVAIPGNEVLRQGLDQDALRPLSID